MIYEINHIWTVEMKWRNGRRSERNLCNCIKKPKKNSRLQRGLNPWPRDTAAMLYQLSYEATDVGWEQASFPQFIYDLFHISLTLISCTGTYEPTIDLLPRSVAS